MTYGSMKKHVIMWNLLKKNLTTLFFNGFEMRSSLPYYGYAWWILEFGKICIFFYILYILLYWLMSLMNLNRWLMGCMAGFGVCTVGFGSWFSGLSMRWYWEILKLGRPVGCLVVFFWWDMGDNLWVSLRCWYDDFYGCWFDSKMGLEVEDDVRLKKEKGRVY